jgi:hypothetical protein
MLVRRATSAEPESIAEPIDAAMEVIGITNGTTITCVILLEIPSFTGFPGSQDRDCCSELGRKRRLPAPPVDPGIWL